MGFWMTPLQIWPIFRFYVGFWERKAYRSWVKLDPSST